MEFLCTYVMMPTVCNYLQCLYNVHIALIEVWVGNMPPCSTSGTHVNRGFRLDGCIALLWTISSSKPSRIGLKRKNEQTALSLSIILRISTCLHEDAMTRLRACPLQCIYPASGASCRIKAWTPTLSLDIFDVPSYPWPRETHACLVLLMNITTVHRQQSSVVE